MPKMKHVEASQWEKEHTEVEKMIIDRRRTLALLKEVIKTEGYHGECDDCHDDTQVIEDPDTADQGHFEFCKNCIERRIIRISRRINKD